MVHRSMPLHCRRYSPHEMCCFGLFELNCYSEREIQTADDMQMIAQQKQTASQKQPTGSKVA
ncbi:hypothetical protein [Pseudoalteromonas holothuriae]|uniref:hypothetical protein n=1 Tax=Pseudoalteromonas holothuriae TaxID=2963714 RepID=UPI0021C09647|nr:hypothetical protein [Pseudoalteromonas sp. CIP111854]